MQKLARSQLNTFKVRLVKGADWVCPVSLKPFEASNLKDAVVDHDHTTGEIRGVLHRSANAVEGKVLSAVARWGGCTEDYSKVIPYLKRLIAYLERPGTGIIYPFHKTTDEKRVTRNAKAREARAAKLARAKLQELK